MRHFHFSLPDEVYFDLKPGPNEWGGPLPLLLAWRLNRGFGLSQDVTASSNEFA